VFNFEGGCYAKVINLSPEGEPDIYRTTQMFGTILENVVLDPATKRVKFDDQSITENTRASYPLSYIPNYVPSGRGFLHHFCRHFHLTSMECQRCHDQGHERCGSTATSSS
jgi:ATP-dependent phosphoenolpyruvate carboxykinase